MPLRHYLSDAPAQETRCLRKISISRRNGIVTFFFWSFPFSRSLLCRVRRNHLVATDASHALSDSLAWDTKPRIVLDVPYKEQQEPLQICLDGILQRLVELARHEGTRQTKTLAAECLHALVVYMVCCTFFFSWYAVPSVYVATRVYGVCIWYVRTHADFTSFSCLEMGVALLWLLCVVCLLHFFLGCYSSPDLLEPVL